MLNFNVNKTVFDCFLYNRFLKTMAFKKRSYLKEKKLLTIVNEGSSLIFVNEGLSLTIVTKTTNL